MLNQLQSRASNPEHSVWVSASAGTGKTKILTDRVIRLLVKGVASHKILCLTFTNAAASEMQLRIYNKLARWSKLSDEELKQEVYLLNETIPNDEEIIYIRSIYHKLLDYENMVNIYTIHSFCQKTLHSFPLEAGLKPEFDVLDKNLSEEMLFQINQTIQMDVEHSIITIFLSANFHDVTIQDIIQDIIANRLKFQNALLQSRKQYNPQEIIERFHSNSLDYSKKSERIYKSLLSLVDTSKTITEFFLTQTGTKKVRLLDSSISKANNGLLDSLKILQDEFYEITQHSNSVNITVYTDILLAFTSVLLKLYDHYKKSKNLLDYDDLIFYTSQLLNVKTDKEWVLYKLDGGIDHLLVDEAQDTSPAQWSIVENLISEFYAEKTDKLDRTIFVVGDEKQSIFSFQGADINSFNIVKNRLHNNNLIAKKDFSVISLEQSYRSSPTILTFVHDILERIKKSEPTLFTADNNIMFPARKLSKGRVELWPLVTSTKEEQQFWPTSAQKREESRTIKLASQIALFIRETIDSHVILPSTSSVAKAGDFLILVRSRDEFLHEIIAQLQQYKLPVAGVDRMIINDNLSVLDLISAAKFVLCPEDDLNLANLIKSPIIGGTEEQLYMVCTDRGSSSIWHMLKSTANSDLATPYNTIYLKLLTLSDLYKNSYAGDFFHKLVDSLDLRAVFLERNGCDSADAINELIYLSYNYANNVNISLQSFVFWFENTRIKIQRNIEMSDKIRIMTVHGSKGLQAPIVILCDTTSVPVSKNKFLWDESEQPVYSMSSVDSEINLNKLKNINKDKNLQEHIRLFYVAMTRAEDYLVVCGHNSGKKLPDYCWYTLVENSMKHLPHNMKGDIMFYGDNFDMIERRVDFNESIEKDGISSNSSEAENNLVSNYTKFYQTYDKYVNLPFSIFNTDHSHFQYGKVFHKILEDTFKAKHINLMRSHPLIKTLDIHAQKQILKSIDNLLVNDEFLYLMTLNVKTEINIGATQGTRNKAGRIDLLSISSDNIMIIDYKSDNSVPTEYNLIPSSYIDQLNFYRHVIQNIYPNHKIICKILWLKSALFTTI